MNRQGKQLYQMLTRVADFGSNNVGLFPKNSAASEILAAIESDVSQMSDRASSQVAAGAAMRISRNAQVAARTTLKSLLEEADQTARALNSDQFRGPVNRSDQALIDCGHSFAVAIEPLKKDFVKHGWPPQFSEDVNAAVEALQRATLDYASGKAMRATAIREFGMAMDDAMGYLRRLDILVAKTFADNSSAMASWTAIRGVNRLGVRKRVVKPPDPAPVPDPAVVPVAA